jgi:ketosteroid isomerase-like protein
MRRTFAFVTIAFAVGLGTGYFARSAGIGTTQRSYTHAADLAAIEKLHEKNIEVTLSQDPQGLLDLWTEDGVLLEPGSPPVVGKQAIQIYNEKGHAANPGFKVLSYAPTFKEIQIADGWAYEWGETDAKFTMSPEVPAISLHIKGVRVLRRQSDGSWKMGLTIWTQ